MKLTTTEAALLRLILDETRRVEALSPYWVGNESMASFSARRIALDDLQSIGIPIDGEWVGSDDAGRKSRLRGLKRLESRGWITLAAKWSRLSHVKLTATGRTEAETVTTCHG